MSSGQPVAELQLSALLIPAGDAGNQQDGPEVSDALGCDGRISTACPSFPHEVEACKK